MVRKPPNYCPDCGSELQEKHHDGRERGYCQNCSELFFQSPRPTAWTVVHEDEKAAFVRTSDGPWTVPGGFVEVEESAAEGAVRELEEETNLRVSSDQIEVIRTGFYIDDPDDGSLLSICFAVPRSEVTGQMKPKNEIAEVEFCDPNLFERREERIRSVDERRYEVALARTDE
jgi:ADP-ribose pyrophosphatase YjhB (NUDIX family)